MERYVHLKEDDLVFAMEGLRQSLDRARVDPTPEPTSTGKTYSHKGSR